VSLDTVRLPFLEPLLPEGVERGRIIGAFFAPASQWRLITSATVASRLQANLRSGVVTTTRFPKEIYSDLTKFGVDIEKTIETGIFHVADWYTCITGRVPAKLPEDMPSSLKVSELGVISSKLWYTGKGALPETDPNFIEFALFDNLARLFSYNDSTSCIKFLNTTLARMKQDTRVGMCGFARGILEKTVYSDLESMCDGIIDVHTIEADGITHTIVRARSFPNIMHTKGWHVMKAQPNSVSLVPASELGGQIYRTVSSLANSQPQ